MTTKLLQKWLVVVLAVTLWSGRVTGQQVPAPDKRPAEKPAEKARAETKAPRGDEQPQPDNPEGRRTPRPDFFGPDDRPPPGGFPGGFRRQGPSSDGRGPDGQPQRDGRPPREGGLFGPTHGFGGGMMPPFDPQRLTEMKKYDPEMYELESKDQELERQTQELSQQLRRAPRDQRDALKKQLQELVQQHFDARQARRDLQLKRLESELERMQTGMQKRVEMREQIVGRRVAELAGEQNDLDF